MKTMLLCMALLLTLTACRKDTQHISKEIHESGHTPPVVLVNGTVTGRVIDENGMPVGDALVELGMHQERSTTEGFFIFRNVPLNQSGTYLQVNHESHWHSSRLVYPQHNRTQYTELKLMPHAIAGQINAQSGGEISTAEGVTLSFPAAAIATASGTPYMGQVQVVVRFLDPSHHQTVNIMPCALRGIDENNRLRALNSFGMMAVELIGIDGQKLNLADDASATISFPIPGTLLSHAKEEIKLWHFDELTGYWRASGIASLKGNTYEAEVSHFSFWGVHQDFEGVQLEGMLVNDLGDPIPNTLVTVISVSENTFETAYSNSDGVFSGFVPENVPLMLHVSNSCNSSIYSLDLGSLTEDTDLGPLTIPESVAASSQISGQLLNCDGDPVSAGIIQISWPQGYQYLLANIDGSFSLSFTHCDATEFSINIIDLNTGQTKLLTQNAEPLIELGNVSVCDGQLDTYISLNFNGEEFFYPEPIQFLQQGRPVFKSEASMYSMLLSIDSPDIGIYENEEVSMIYYAYFETPDIPLFYQGGSCSVGNCANLSITITSYGAVGDYIEGTYEGTMDMTTSTTSYPEEPVSGAFRVLRQF